jgi:tetratricopeptide (TPR) repeat protein
LTRTYRAFLSYSHADERWAAWLQRSLERYRVPRRLRQQRAGLPARLNPVFRDREELASSSDLGDSIRNALARSEALVVVCSPAAAKSRWVNEEIRVFRALAPGRPVLCLMVAGSPEPGVPDCAFPPALLRDDDGQRLPEPLAADPRTEADGKRGARVKIAAGLLGVGVDALRQRDQQRRNRVLAAIATGAAAIAVVTIGLAINASIARDEAELRRDQAEELIEFMLVDLRKRLQPIGRLDVLDAVGDQALAYFAELGDALSPEDALSRVMALRQIGEVRFEQGSLAPALEAFTASRDYVQALHRADPANDELLFELGQAEFWVGYVAWERQDLEGAGRSFETYMRHTRELLERAPDDPDYQAELMYAFSNLGSVALEAGRPADALANFEASNDIARRIADENPDDAYGWVELREGLSWSGTALTALGDLEGARSRYAEAVDAALRARAIDDSPVLRFEWAQEVTLLAGAHRDLGDEQQARALYGDALEAFEWASEHDPGNARWQREAWRAHFRLAELALALGAHEGAGPHLDAALEGFDQLVSQDPTNLKFRLDRVSVWRIDAERRLAAGEIERALERALQARAEAGAVLRQSEAGTARLEGAMTGETLGRLRLALGERDKAESAWLDALDMLPPAARCDLLEAAVRARLLLHLGRDGEAAPLRARLEESGFRDPVFGLPENS